MPFFGGGGGDYHIIATNIKGGTSAAPAIIGTNNMALGNGSLHNAINSDNNISIGNSAAYGLLNDLDNVAIGVLALYSLANNGLGINSNVAIGGNAFVSLGTDAAASVESSGNVAIGFNAGQYLQNGLFNTTIGLNAGQYAATANDCIYIGKNATASGFGASPLSKEIVIGNDITGNGDNSITIGDATYTTVIIGGVTVSSATGALLPNGAIIGDPGTEGSGITVGGVTYNSTFKVSDIAGTNIAQSILHRHSTTWEPITVTARSNSDTNAHGAVVNGMALHTHYATGWTGTEYNIFGSIQFAADAAGTISDASSPGDIVFSTTPDGANFPAEAVRINSAKAVLFNGSAGTAGQVLQSAGAGAPPVWSSAAGGPVLGTPQSAAGTAVDFTGIPAGVKRLAVSLTGISTTGSSNPLIQLGDSGGIETTLYSAGSNYLSTATGNSSYTTGFGAASGNAAASLHGTINFTLIDPATNTWAAEGVLSDTASGATFTVAGSKSLTATLDRVRLTTVAGTDTFDAGKVNILYE